MHLRKFDGAEGALVLFECEEANGADDIFRSWGWTYCACTALYLTLLRASLHESDKADVAHEFFVGLIHAGLQVKLIFCVAPSFQNRSYTTTISFCQIPQASLSCCLSQLSPKPSQNLNCGV